MTTNDPKTIELLYQYVDAKTDLHSFNNRQRERKVKGLQHELFIIGFTYQDIKHIDSKLQEQFIKMNR